MSDNIKRQLTIQQKRIFLTAHRKKYNQIIQSARKEIGDILTSPTFIETKVDGRLVKRKCGPGFSTSSLSDDILFDQNVLQPGDENDSGLSESRAPAQAPGQVLVTQGEEISSTNQKLRKRKLSDQSSSSQQAQSRRVRSCLGPQVSRGQTECSGQEQETCQPPEAGQQQVLQTQSP